MQTYKPLFSEFQKAVGIALFESWIGIASLVAFVAYALTGQPLYAAATITVAAAMFMLGFAKTEQAMTDRGPEWWKKHPTLQPLHRITGEGELAGIFVGTIAGLCLWCTTKRFPHLPIYDGALIAGVLGAAIRARKSMALIMTSLAQCANGWWALFLGALSASLTGPAASLYLAEHLKSRVSDQDRPRATTLMAAAIGSGNGILPFVAPPVLIVWKVLKDNFHWDLGKLFLLVGLACIVHVAVCTLLLWRYVRAESNDQPRIIIKIRDLTSLIPLVLLVTAHILWSEHPLLFAADIVVAITNLVLAKREYAGCEEEKREEGHAAAWQPVILGFLLMSLNLIGEWAKPGIIHLASFIPGWLPLFFLAVLLCWATATVSHVADNALASVVFISIPAGMIGKMPQGSVDMMAAAVILGALFGGFLLVPANLPNFPLARGMGVDSKTWARVAWRIYPTILVHIVALGLMYLLLN